MYNKEKLFKTRGLQDRIEDDRLIQGYDGFIRVASNNQYPSIVSFLNSFATKTRKKNIFWVDYCGWDGRAVKEAVNVYNKHQEHSELKGIVIDQTNSAELPLFTGNYATSPNVSFVKADLKSEMPDIDCDFASCIWGLPYIKSQTEVLEHMLSHINPKGGCIASFLYQTKVDEEKIIDAFKHKKIRIPKKGFVNVSVPEKQIQWHSVVLGIFRDKAPIKIDFELLDFGKLERCCPDFYAPQYSRLEFRN